MKYEELTPEAFLSLFSGTLLCKPEDLLSLMSVLLNRPVDSQDMQNRRLVEQARETLVLWVAREGFKRVNRTEPVPGWLDKVRKDIIERYPFVSVSNEI